VANGDGGEFVHFLTDPRGRRTQVTQFKDKASLESLGQDRYLYLLSRRARHMRNDAISPRRSPGRFPRRSPRRLVRPGE